MNQGKIGASNKGSSHLLKTTIIYFIGSFITKASMFLVLPLITRTIPADEYGKYDLVLTTTMIVLPLFTLMCIESVFRFLFDATESEVDKVISNMWTIVFIGLIVAALFFAIIGSMYFNLSELIQIFLYYVTTVLLNVYQRIARSLKYNTTFAISGTIGSISNVILIVLFILNITTNMDALLQPYIISTFITLVYLEIVTKGLRRFSIKLIDKNEIKRQIIFGLPLVPNTISWWSVSLLNKLIILKFLGLDSTGIYALGSKFAVIISFAIDLFKMSWQEATIVTYDFDDKNKFYSKTFNSYLINVFLLTSIITLGVLIFKDVLIGVEYKDSIQIIPLYLLSTATSSLSTFYGVGYVASKKTSGAFWTTMVAAIMSISFTLLFINILGLFAPIIGMIIAYLALWVIRHFSMKNIFPIVIDRKILILSIIITGVSLVVAYFNNLYLTIPMLIASITTFVLVNNELIQNFYIKYIKKNKKGDL